MKLKMKNDSRREVSRVKVLKKIKEEEEGEMAIDGARDKRSCELGEATRSGTIDVRHPGPATNAHLGKVPICAA